MMRLLAALLLAQDPGLERHDKARARLLDLLVKARAEKQDADDTSALAAQNRKKVEQLMEKLKDPATDERARKAVGDLLPKMLEDARCLAERSAETSAAAAARIRLTEKALANLKAPPPSGPLAAALRTLAEREAREADEYFGGKDHGFVSDPVAEKRLSGLLDRVFEFAPFSAERPRIKIVKGGFQGFAAFTTTDTIYVLTDELDRRPSDTSLLLTLGHELAHAQLGHYAEFNAHLLKEDALQALQGPGAADPDTAARIREAGVQARTSSYSVEQELQAEILGAQMAIGAGVPPGLILQHLETEARLHEKEEAAKSVPRRALDRLVRSHPDPRETLEQLREVLGPAAGSR